MMNIINRPILYRTDWHKTSSPYRSGKLEQKKVHHVKVFNSPALGL